MPPLFVVDRLGLVCLRVAAFACGGAVAGGLFSRDGRKPVAEITTPDGFELTTTSIGELSAPPFTRLGLKLRKPVTEATVTGKWTEQWKKCMR